MNPLNEAEAMLAKPATKAKASAPLPPPPPVAAPTLAEAEALATAATASTTTATFAPPAPPTSHSTAAKYYMGAFLKIPGGLAGRVTGVFPSLDLALQDPDVAPYGKSILRPGTPNQNSLYYYKCKSNALAHVLVVGELDAHLISQGPTTE